MSTDNPIGDLMSTTPATRGDVARLAAKIDEIAASIRALAGTLATAPAKAPSGPAKTYSGATLPNYGRRKGEPIAGAPVADLEYYAAGCRRTLDDPGKSKWHEKEKTLLAAIEAEIARQKGGAPAGDSPGFTDDDIPF